MAQRYRFQSSYAEWDRDGGPSRRGRVTIRDTENETTRTYDLTAGELRQAIRHFLRALAFTKEVRRKGQHETTWTAAVDRRIEPVMKFVESVLPKKRAESE
jgi:hypothetical protein